MFKIVDLKSPQRVLEYIVKHTSVLLPSKSAVKKAFKKKQIFINGAVAMAGDWLAEGDEITYKSVEDTFPKAFSLDLEILYEDEYMALINKPAGFSVSGNFHKTIQNALSSNLKVSSHLDVLSIPRPVHRLDKLTTGILIVAKTKSAQLNLSQQFEFKTISKTYYAIVKGKLQGTGEFNDPIEGLSASTKFKSIRCVESLSYNWVSLIELNPITGRTHQLRIHLARAGFPIVGDYVHDTANVLKGKGLFLAACKIEFTHPHTLKMHSCTIPYPAKYTSLLEREYRRWEKFKS